MAPMILAWIDTYAADENVHTGVENYDDHLSVSRLF